MAVGFGLVLAVLAAIAILTVRSEEADRLVTHTVEVRQAAEGLISEIRDAESGQRGYMLTGRSEYLVPVDRAETKIPTLVARLKTLTMDNSVQQARLARLAPLIDERMDVVRRTVALAQRGDQENAVALMATGEGRTLMERVVSEMTAFFETELDLLHARQETSRQLRLWLTALIVLGLLTAILLAGILAVATRRAVSGLIERTKELEAEIGLRQEAEATLRQAQKMEAVGHLSGGIAHDFNNLLTIIIGNLDTMKRRLAELAKSAVPSELIARLEAPLDAAVKGAQSSAQLTQRLLAFSRRQTLEPARVDINRLVSGMLDMLRRTLGSDINVETVFGAGLWSAFADRHQLENVLLNLTLNANAAMPEGGCLTLETANTYLDDAYVRRFGDVKAGQYVVLCVTDTGTGIAREILDQVFDPFFTTKPPGEGSGLGLAMVHGFIKQSGGHVRIYSEEGRGTTVKVYLPRYVGEEEVSAAPAGKIEDLSPIPRAKPNESILLVEDNAGVREYARDILLELGYGVREAASEQEALRLVAKKPHISLLFTDVVLGDSNGRVLAEKLRRIYPGLLVLFTTGYTRNAIVHQGRLDPDVHLLNKPFTQHELARKVRELLDEADEKTPQAVS
jgi:signal transduction histidine kinase/ActR/RegA family two-component response regulator